jgi:diguanylate cyclase (GGDEF)-like protein/PAS domain S-box-containing protein
MTNPLVSVVIPVAFSRKRAKELYRLGWLLPWLLLVVSLAITYLIWDREQKNAGVDLKIDFDYRVREVDSRLDQRMKAYEQILRGARGLFLSTPNVKRREFRDYYNSLYLEDNYPSSMGIGFVPIVSSAQKQKHIASLRAEGLSTYAIEPKGERNIYTPVTYLEPLSDRNLKTFGYDMYSNPERRAAMELARDTGEAVNSEKVQLAIDDKEDPRLQSGFLMFLPVYKKGSPSATLAERRANIVGWVYAPFRMIDLMSGVIGEIASDIDIEIHDGEDVTDASMMYDPDLSGAGGNPDSLYKSDSRIQIAQHYWTVVIRSLYGFEIRADSGRSTLIAYTGIGASLMLALFTWTLVRGRAVALQAAEEINRELTERKRAEEGLRLAATVVKIVEEAVLVTDENNLIISVNPSFTTITGYLPEDVIGQNPSMLSSGKHSKEFYKALWETLLSTGSWHGEMYDRRKSGELYIKWLSIKLVRDDSGRLTHHVGVFSDISERKASEERLQRLAHYDVLTDLPNRMLFSESLHVELAKAKLAEWDKRDKLNKTRLALMFLDLDKFKQINDTLGHAVGDQLLRETAKRLLHCVRETDTVSRLGGDEFVVLLPTIDGEQDAMLVAYKILHSLGQVFELAGHSLHISASIGLVLYPQHGDDEESLTKNADIAMYYAKASGRNNVKLFQPDMLESGAHCALDKQ